MRGRADTIIRDRFVLIGFGKEGQELPIDGRVAPRQPAELAAQAAMRLRGLAGAFEKVRLGGVIGRKVNLARTMRCSDVAAAICRASSRH